MGVKASGEVGCCKELGQLVIGCLLGLNTALECATFWTTLSWPFLSVPNGFPKPLSVMSGSRRQVEVDLFWLILVDWEYWKGLGKVLCQHVTTQKGPYRWVLLFWLLMTTHTRHLPINDYKKEFQQNTVSARHSLDSFSWTCSAHKKIWLFSPALPSMKDHITWAT